MREMKGFVFYDGLFMGESFGSANVCFCWECRRWSFVLMEESIV